MPGKQNFPGSSNTLTEPDNTDPGIVTDAPGITAADHLYRHFESGTSLFVIISKALRRYNNRCRQHPANKGGMTDAYLGSRLPPTAEL